MIRGPAPFSKKISKPHMPRRSLDVPDSIWLSTCARSLLGRLLPNIHNDGHCTEGASVHLLHSLCCVLHRSVGCRTSACSLAREYVAPLRHASCVHVFLEV